MATTKNGTYYPSNYDEVADVPTDMKKMAESIDKQLDSKVDKVEGKGLSTNDFTNEDKDKLDGLSNYDDSEIKQDIADIQDKNTSQDELIAKLKDNMFNLTAEGTSINVQDASDLPAVLEVSGGVRQDGREGYNLFNSDKALTSQTKTQGGATVTKNNDKSFTVTGSGNLTASFGGGYIDYTHEETLKNLKIGQYTCYFGVTTYPLCAIQFFKKENDKETLLISRDNGSNIKAVIDITDEIINSTGLFIRVYLYGASGKQIVPGTIYPMLYEGTEEKPFEGYGATPSPDYPSEVEVVEGSVEINKVNKNWFDLTKLEPDNNNGLESYSIENSNKILLKNKTSSQGSYFTYAFQAFKLDLKNGKYVLQLKVNTNSSNYRVLIRGKKESTNDIITTIDQSSSKEKTFEINYDEYLSYNIEFYANQSYIESQAITIYLDIQIELEEEATDYISHESEVYNLPIQQPMLSGDTFVKEDGNWFEVHLWNKLIITDKDVFTTYDAGADAIGLIRSSKLLNSVNNSGFSNYLANAKTTSVIKNVFAVSDLTLFIKIDKTIISTLEEFKQWLATKNNEGNPLYIWYQVTTPTKLPCTPEQAAVLEQLYNMPTYRPVTNIFTQEDLANLKLNYVADSKIYVDNKINAMQANLDTINQLLSTTATSAMLLNNMQADLESEVI